MVSIIKWWALEDLNLISNSTISQNVTEIKSIMVECSRGPDFGTLPRQYVSRLLLSFQPFVYLILEPVAIEEHYFLRHQAC